MKNATTLMTAEQIAAAKTSELVAFYNANVPAEKVIKKFADRATAESRVSELVAELSKAEKETKAASKKAEKAGDIGHREGTDRRTTKRGTAADRKEQGEIVKTRLAEGKCPFCGGHEDITHGSTEDNPNLYNNYLTCHPCGITYHKRTGKEYVAPDTAARSAAIAASWADPAVKAARSERHHVRVHGVEYRSVREAFKALSLPDSQHIKFRMTLKAAGKATFEAEDGTKHNFKLVSAAEPAEA
jgi:cell wall-associated NlpC family hydrolase